MPVYAASPARSIAHALLSLILGSVATAVQTEEGAVPVVLAGTVRESDGSPAAGVLVRSSAGGEARTDDGGRFRLALETPVETESVELTVVGADGRLRLSGRSVALLPALGGTSVGPLHLSPRSTCSPEWLPAFGQRPGTDGSVEAFAVYDDGRGPALYAAGAFTLAGGVAANRIARWDGMSWSAPTGGLTHGDVRTLAVHDDGNGSALYVGGQFDHLLGLPNVRNVAKWDGTRWSALGDGLNSAVEALTVYDDGEGAALYVGGGFTSAGGRLANRVARWDGTEWSKLGGGTNGRIEALAVHDDGSGPALYAGGWFTSAGSTAANRIARWDGASWSALGSGIDGYVVRALSVHDDGTGPALYAGGDFTSAGGVPAEGIARWDGARWTAVGSGAGSVHALAVHDDGGGPALCAAVTTFGPIQTVRKWDGSTWTLLGRGSDSPVHALAGYDDGSRAALFAGGEFAEAGGVLAMRVAVWDDAHWSPLGAGFYGDVRAALPVPGGSGRALYVGGSFTSVDGTHLERIGRWNGVRWSPLGGGVNDVVEELVLHDDGSGPALFAAGRFTTAGSTPANRIARWDGVRWSALGSGVDGFAVQALAVHDDGTGPVLYAGGDFTAAGGAPASRIARWDGVSWSAVGSGIEGLVVDALAVHDDGTGPALYAGGEFTAAGGAPASRTARWDGARWVALGGGTDGRVRALVSHADASGSRLYAAGDFTSAGGVAAQRIAAWDGTRWSAVGSGFDGRVNALQSFEAGFGPTLYAGGGFATASGVAARNVARWNGASWSALGGSLGSGAVYTMSVHDAGSGSSLLVGGSFNRAFDTGDSFLARWSRESTPPVLAPGPVVAWDRTGSPPGEVVNFDVIAVDDADPAPSVECVPPSGSFFPRGTTLVTCTATDACGNEATAQFAVTVLTRARPASSP